MKIQFNTDKTIDGDKRNQEYFTSLITDALKRYQSNISRIEVHISDENGRKEGVNDIRCLLEARLNGKKPMAITSNATTVEAALSGALKKLKASLETIIGQMSKH